MQCYFYCFSDKGSFLGKSFIFNTSFASKQFCEIVLKCGCFTNTIAAISNHSTQNDFLCTNNVKYAFLTANTCV